MCNINPVSWWGNDGFLSHMALFNLTQKIRIFKDSINFSTVLQKDCYQLSKLKWSSGILMENLVTTIAIFQFYSSEWKVKWTIEQNFSSRHFPSFSMEKIVIFLIDWIWEKLQLVLWFFLLIFQDSLSGFQLWKPIKSVLAKSAKP